MDATGKVDGVHKRLRIAKAREEYEARADKQARKADLDEMITEGRQFACILADPFRASGFKQIYEWLADHRGLFIRGNRRELLIVLRAADWIELRRRHDEL